MATRRTNALYAQPYVQGNTVRKPEPVRVPQRRQTEEPQRRIRRDNVVRRNQEKALHMDLPYVFLLTVAAVCMLYICVNYLQVQATMTARISRIESLEKKLETLKTQNDALETMINTSVDLEEVYRIATEELGMVYANKQQVLLYDRTESEYVRQYEDIPKHQ